MSELTINTTITYQNQQNSQSRVTHHIGGTRSGKTYAIIQWIIVQALQAKEEITIVRKTIPSLKRTVMKDFKEIMQSLGLWSDNEFNISDRIYTFSMRPSLIPINGDTTNRALSTCSFRSRTSR